MKEYRTSSNYEEYNTKKGIVSGEYFDLETQPSLTDQSQAMTPRDILHNFTRAQPVRVLVPQQFGAIDPETGQPVPNEFNEIGSRIHKMDKMEKVETAFNIKQEIKGRQRDLEQKQAKAEKLKAERAANKAAEKNNPPKEGDE